MFQGEKGIQPLADFLKRWGAPDALSSRVIELVRPFSRSGEGGGPAYAENEKAARSGHDLTECFRTIGLKAERFVFASAKAFDLPGWPSANAKGQMRDRFSEDVLYSKTSFAEMYSCFVDAALLRKPEDLEPNTDELMEIANCVEPGARFLLDVVHGRTDMIYALADAAIHGRADLVDALEPMAHLMADAVPAFEVGEAGSGHWLMVIA